MKTKEEIMQGFDAHSLFKLLAQVKQLSVRDGPDINNVVEWDTGILRVLALQTLGAQIFGSRQ